MTHMAKDKPKSDNVLAGGINVTKGPELQTRMAVLLWGAATCGKSTFAATAPGDKLWLSFGDNEHVSVAGRDDVYVADISNMRYDDLFKHAQSDNPFGLDQYLSEHTNVATVVVDSTTAIEYKALQKAVGTGVGASRSFTPTMETPGLSAYGGRNAILLEVITGLLRVTAKHGVHIIFTAHEADPVLVQGQSDTIDYIAVQLGGKLVNGVTWRLSEIWFMSQETTGDRVRKLAVRPTRKRRPMKSRMFAQNGSPEFTIRYDNEKPDEGQMTIAGFYNAWVDAGYNKIPVPEDAPKPSKK